MMRSLLLLVGQSVRYDVEANTYLTMLVFPVQEGPWISISGGWGNLSSSCSCWACCCRCGHCLLLPRLLDGCNVAIPQAEVSRAAVCPVIGTAKMRIVAVRLDCNTWSW